ncbi:MAG: hypothetical protein SchgKO_10610 [Schleiferiaceae bacterium]
MCVCFSLSSFAQLPYPIVDTKVSDHYSNTAIISAPSAGDPFYGQDATYAGNQPSYTNNGDGTITDNVTGLTWQRDMGDKISYADAVLYADTMTLGGHSDWRIPTIKELYSLAHFTGRCFGDQAVTLFIDTNYFEHPIGDVTIGERQIDAQTWSSTPCVDLIVIGDTAIYGYNFVDGRLKGYPKYDPLFGAANEMYFRMVRGNTSYGINQFSDNGDGTITDSATGLMWQQADDGNTYDWQDALDYAENLSLAGHSDWRLPNAKELQSIVDYSRSPNSTSSPAIAPLFSCTGITDPYGNSGQYGYYWTGSPLQDGPYPYSDAVYFCFGEAQGEMEMPPSSGNYQLLDVHGAGAQRNDPKTGNPADYPDFFGPQGDVRYVFNFVRCVRDVSSTISIEEAEIDWELGVKIYPNPASSTLVIEWEDHLTPEVIEIKDIQGKLLRVVSPQSGNHTVLNVSDYPRGLYLIVLSNESGQIIRKVAVN